MTIFDKKRLPENLLNLDYENIRKGFYSDKYFIHIYTLLSKLSEKNYQFNNSPSKRLKCSNIDLSSINIGDIEVQAQYFTRRSPYSIIAGIDRALAIIKNCSGYFKTSENFINTFKNLKVSAIHDGTKISYNGNPKKITPVILIQGKYKDFALLETALLGTLSRLTRIATNTYNTLIATKKPIMFFPARYDFHETQTLDGYAYLIGLNRYNMDYSKDIKPMVSTDAQGLFANLSGSGTMSHSLITCFLGNTSESILSFAQHLPVEIPRVALVDFDNNSQKTTLEVMRALFKRYISVLDIDNNQAQKFKLYGIRLDTSSNLLDKALDSTNATNDDKGVSPMLVLKLRKAINDAWKNWNIKNKKMATIAKLWCHDIKIIASSGFDIKKITKFRKIPVDIYGIGSALFSNSIYENTNNDFTADVVKVKIHNKWYNLSKVGRVACKNPNLQKINE